MEKSNIDVCIDDFGSGYTSLIYVRKYKIKYIKISNDFVSNAISNKLDMQIVTAIISLAKSMKLRETAKGVESHEIKELLKELAVQSGEIVDATYLSVDELDKFYES